MEYADNIAEMITKYRGSTPEIKVQSLRELYAITKESIFENAANDLLERLDMCPNCFRDLLFKHVREPRGEYMGSPAYETICIKICPNCGWKED